MIGKVKRVLFPPHDTPVEAGGFSIVLCTDEANRDVILKGPIGPVARDCKYEITGMVKDDKSGQYISVETIKPFDKGAKIESLTTIDGIGIIMASKLFDHFGDQVLERLKQNPSLLLEVIPGPKGEKLVANFQSLHSAHDVTSELIKQGVSAKKALRIYNVFKDDAINIINKHPYKLSRIIGFDKADNLATAKGLNHSIERVEALIEKVLLNNEQNGNVCILFSELIKRMTALRISNQDMHQALTNMFSNKDIVLHEIEGCKYIYLQNTDKAEREIVEALIQLKKSVPTTETVANIDEEINIFEKEAGFSLAVEQRAAVVAGLTHPVTLITGGPGTGKTTIINCIRKIFAKHNSSAKILLCAPTGLAAKKMTASTGYEACTIHRALGINPDQIDSHNMLDYDMVIADEISMLDVFIASSLLKAVKLGTRLIMIGDPDQLPSVGAGSVLADFLASDVIPIARLVAVQRQKGDSNIAFNANAMRKGITTFELGDDFQFINRFDFESAATEMIDRFIEAVQRDGINNVIMLTPRRGAETATGAEALNLRVHDIVNPPSPEKAEIKIGKNIFRVGDKVMQTSNTSECSNGEVGYIVKINNSLVTINFDGREVDCKREDMDSITLAYAITVHKSQGSEYKTVIFNIMEQHGIMLQRNLAYTAITRAKAKVLIVGSRSAFCQAVESADNPDLQRLSLLSTRLKANAMK